jgi:hypothetical protein
LYYSANHGLVAEDLNNHVVVDSVTLAALHLFAIHPSGDSIYYPQGYDVKILGKR